MVADDSALSLEPDVGIRLRALAALEGAVLTEDELSHLGESYPGCRGKGQWDVREYVCHTGVGAREYRVVRAWGVREQLGEVYPGCRGRGQWDVPEYVCKVGLCGCGYRVVRSGSVQY